MRHSVSTWVEAAEVVNVASREDLDATYLFVGEWISDNFASIKGTPTERRDFLARLILAAQAEVDRLDVAAAEPNGRAVAS